MFGMGKARHAVYVYCPKDINKYAVVWVAEDDGNMFYRTNIK